MIFNKQTYALVALLWCSVFSVGQGIHLRQSVTQKLLRISTTNDSGYCNAGASNCGDACTIDADCDGGYCWKAKDTCGTTGYCNQDATNCGSSCTADSDCDKGSCFAKKDTCPGTTPTQSPITPGPPGPSPTGDQYFGTYLGALPAGLAPPPLSSLPDSYNLVMLSFVIDHSNDGNFIAFGPWVSNGINYNTIHAAKEAVPGRKFLISLGGAADYGGTFSIKSGMTVDQWVDASYTSVSGIVDAYGADGVELQFEGGTGDLNFVEAMTKLLQKFKGRKYVTALGPFYGGTSKDYGQLPLDNVDIINCQMYAMNHNDVSSVIDDVNSAIAQFPGGESKFVMGLNSAGRNPTPDIGLEAYKKFANKISGVFTWDAEHDVRMTPPFCIINESYQISQTGAFDTGKCAW